MDSSLIPSILPAWMRHATLFVRGNGMAPLYAPAFESVRNSFSLASLFFGGAVFIGIVMTLVIHRFKRSDRPMHA